MISEPEISQKLRLWRRNFLIAPQTSISTQFFSDFFFALIVRTAIVVDFGGHIGQVQNGLKVHFIVFAVDFFLRNFFNRLNVEIFHFSRPLPQRSQILSPISHMLHQLNVSLTIRNFSIKLSTSGDTQLFTLKVLYQTLSDHNNLFHF